MAMGGAGGLYTYNGLLELLERVRRAGEGGRNEKFAMTGTSRRMFTRKA